MIRRALVSGLALPLLAACAGTPGQADAPRRTPPAHSTASTAAPRTPPDPQATSPVSPIDLARGADPKVPYWDPNTRDLHDGTRVLHAGLAHVIGLYVAGDAYLLATDDGGPVTLHRLERSGRQSVIATLADRTFLVSPDGSRVAYSHSTEDAFTVVVADAADGTVQQQRRYPNGADSSAITPVALEDNRLLLTQGDRTWWWDFGASVTLTIAHDQTGAVDAADDRIAATVDQDSARWTVGSIATGQRAWSLPRQWQPRAFSPRGTWLLSGRPRAFDARGYDVYDAPLRVSRTEHGGRARDFRGDFGFYDVGRPRWESDGTFLALAGLPRGAGTTQASVAWVRCRVSGQCEAASPTFVFDTDHTATVPVWVLAQQ